MGKCQEYIEKAQSDIEDNHDAINAIFHCLEFIAREIDNFISMDRIDLPFPCDNCKHEGYCKSDYICSKLKEFRKLNPLSLRAKPMRIGIGFKEREGLEYVKEEEKKDE